MPSIRRLLKDLDRIKFTLGRFIAANAKETVFPVDTQNALLAIEIYAARRESVEEGCDAMLRHVKARQMLDSPFQWKERRFT